MVTNTSLVTAYCLDQDRAKEFYADVLGFEARTDISTGQGFRWVTIAHPGQPELEVTLMTPGPPLDEDAAAFVRGQPEKGSTGGLGLAVDDCRRTYAELSAKGVTFCRSRRSVPTASRPWCATCPATGWCSSSAGSSPRPTSPDPRPGAPGHHPVRPSTDG
jgi:catechol 2,3-dioxygenase-like lactoylglutathione lyase family enzyme